MRRRRRLFTRKQRRRHPTLRTIQIREGRRARVQGDFEYLKDRLGRIAHPTTSLAYARQLAHEALLLVYKLQQDG